MNNKLFRQDGSYITRAERIVIAESDKDKRDITIGIVIMVLAIVFAMVTGTDIYL